MKSGRTLIELATEIQRQMDTKRDFVVDQGTMEMKTNGHISLSLDGVDSWGVTDYAHEQIATKLDIPRKYYDRMRFEAPELLVRNTNEWFGRNSGNKRMIRTLDGNVRAFVSSKFRCLDHVDMMEAVLPSLNDMKFEIKSCELTDRKLYLKAVTPRITGEVVVGDPVQFGLVLSNSEVGAGSVNIEPMIYTLRCTNGMICQDQSVRKFHVTKEWEQLGEILRDSTRALSDSAFWEQVKDILRATVSQEFFDGQILKLRSAKSEKITGNPVKVVEVTAKKIGLREHEKGGVLNHLISGGDLSQYGLLNAVTRASQDVENYERATELEKFGGEILEMPRSAWEEIAKAC